MGVECSPFLARLYFSACLAACVLQATPIHAADRFAEVEVTSEEIAEGIYMLTRAGGNIGASIGADGTLLIYNQFAPFADKLAATITSIGGDRPRLVLNTRYHGDHTSGNAEFGQSGVIPAHENVRARLITQSNLPATAMLVVTYADRVTIHLNGDELSLIHLPDGHTDGDSLVWFKKANVLHRGDQLLNGAFPYIDLGAGGTVDGYTENLRRVIDEMPADIKIIPRHGPMADIATVAVSLAVIDQTHDIIVSGLNAGKSEAKIAQDLSPYAKSGQGFISVDRWISIVKADQAQRGSL